jgi:hypothetical protein
MQLVAKVLPSREAINEVQRIATSFWNDHPDQYIAIHCAYGEAAARGGACRSPAGAAPSLAWRHGTAPSAPVLRVRQRCLCISYGAGQPLNLVVPAHPPPQASTAQALSCARSSARPAASPWTKLLRALPRRGRQE